MADQRSITFPGLSGSSAAITDEHRSPVIHRRGEVARFLLMVRTRPLAGREAEYHRWYDDFHLAEVLRVPGFVTAERCAPPSGEDAEFAGDGTHLALFTVESDDFEATVAAFREAQASMEQPSCLAPESVSLTWWRSLGSRTTASSHG
ncbi:hypothetical protein [Streptomyces olivaceus]|uniref:hypothetical protein n=1 Tax=Streptomyces olivaceus TaxID=47716 RepID=UPI0003998046|nr:hypothetical protein [Streptomyces olivaceus]MBZ6083040.1 hypothetical protein [Streptomyces olivaceus]MBZ6102521.1 hypothetical protein [Streptomyces olivaceus]MBZ6214471.1 hypothetical protein [Streptomyces olivaceus]MBZ6217704.1 hypothetical protein [Streptomyces olivaceus]MBZ6235210.1 hypothetical protein [Streptomyces olivaceus]